MIGWTNMADGGVNIQNGKAVIHVTTLTGSSISFTKDGIIAKVLSPDKSYVRADNNMFADWYYSINSGNYGTWTVTATLGTDIQSDTVTISDNKQYDLTFYTFYIYNQGNTYDSRTGGYEGKAWRQTSSSYNAKIPTIIYENTCIRINFQTEGSGVFLTKIPIDITKFNTLKALVDLPATSSTSGNYYFGLLSSNSATYWGSVVSNSISLRSTTTRTETTISVDIYNTTGDNYVMFAQNYANAVNMTVYAIWLE